MPIPNTKGIAITDKTNIAIITADMPIVEAISLIRDHALEGI